MKLASSFFFETMTRGVRPVWIDEAEINLKFLKSSSPKLGLKNSLARTF